MKKNVTLIWMLALVLILSVSGIFGQSGPKAGYLEYVGENQSRNIPAGVVMDPASHLAYLIDTGYNLRELSGDTVNELAQRLSYVVDYLRKLTIIEAVIGMPESLFKTSGKGGTHTKTCLLIARKKSTSESEQNGKRAVFMAEAKWCGHDSRGSQIPNNDLPIILENSRRGIDLKHQNHLGYQVNNNDIIDNILAPRYYDPEPSKFLGDLNNTHDLVSVKHLVETGVLSFSTGNEIGKLTYGTGAIPFVRTSDISNWEIKVEPKQCVSEEVYLQYKASQDVKEGDILMVRDGTYLIGNCAYVSKYDVKIVYQSHIYKIRVEKPDVISPFLLIAILSSEPVVRQIKAKRFTQDIIDSLGKRVYEIVLPIPKEKEEQEMIVNIVKKSINDRIEARELARKATKAVVNGFD